MMWPPVDPRLNRRRLQLRPRSPAPVNQRIASWAALIYRFCTTQRDTEPLRWGLSYATSIPAVVPRALYPGTKIPAISTDLGDALYEGVGPVYGWGFSPVAEGFANFGLPGAFGTMVLWSMFFAWLGSNRYRSLAGLVVCATLLQEAVNANRIDFRYVYFESVYCVIAAMLALVVMKAVNGMTYRGPRTLSAQSHQKCNSLRHLEVMHCNRNSENLTATWRHQ